MISPLKVALLLFPLLLSKAQENSEYDWTFNEETLNGLGEWNATCFNTSVSVDQYPYYGLLVSSGENEFEQICPTIPAIVITDRYVIGLSDSSIDIGEACRANVTLQVGLDKKSEKANTEYEVEIVHNTIKELFKTKKTIIFNAGVQPIRVAEAGEGPKPGDSMSVTMPYYDAENDQLLVIPVDNVSIASSQDCEKIVSDKDSITVGRKNLNCSDSLFIWMKFPKQPCTVIPGYINALIVNNKLIGLSDLSTSWSTGLHTVQAYVNLAKLRVAVKELLRI
ncbi:hypothetical protein QAD02_019176 [Eretmocerus hayati]|uniref:Uncharacterized protein n=1 Tax=Eretmocerus hayati TaxID=131215 RepID=A0ACC2PJA1_9HYME|nr:hypothetical protein QAD02_019176 [Eretmocerus hayati]